MKKIKYLILILLCCGAIIFVFDSYKTYFMKNTSFSSETVYLKIPSNTTKPQLLDSLSNYLIDLRTFEKAANKKEYPMAITGTVKFFNADKGYGFIAPDDGTPDAFVHITAVERAGLATLREKDRVSYDLEQDRRGKMAAVNLTHAE